SRAPFLDHRLVEMAWRVPPAMRATQTEGKILPRRLLHRRLPAGLVGPPKRGFRGAVWGWVRGALWGWGGGLLFPGAARCAGFFDPGAIERCWRDHLAGRDRDFMLWDVLMFEAWRRDR